MRLLNFEETHRFLAHRPAGADVASDIEGQRYVAFGPGCNSIETDVSIPFIYFRKPTLRSEWPKHEDGAVTFTRPSSINCIESLERIRIQILTNDASLALNYPQEKWEKR